MLFQKYIRIRKADLYFKRSVAILCVWAIGSVTIMGCGANQNVVSGARTSQSQPQSKSPDEETKVTSSPVVTASGEVDNAALGLSFQEKLVAQGFSIADATKLSQQAVRGIPADDALALVVPSFLVRLFSPLVRKLVGFVIGAVEGAVDSKFPSGKLGDFVGSLMNSVADAIFKSPQEKVQSLPNTIGQLVFSYLLKLDGSKLTEGILSNAEGKLNLKEAIVPLLLKRVDAETPKVLEESLKVFLKFAESQKGLSWEQIERIQRLGLEGFLHSIAGQVDLETSTKRVLLKRYLEQYLEWKLPSQENQALLPKAVIDTLVLQAKGNIKAFLEGSLVVASEKELALKLLEEIKL